MSTLRVNTIQDTAGSGSPAINGLAKAWVNFNGTGTVAIRASLNVSSVTDNGTGQYQVNFTTAMTDVNYAVSIAVIPDAAFQSGSAGTRSVFIGTQATGSVSVQTGAQANPVFLDFPTIGVAVFR